MPYWWSKERIEGTSGGIGGLTRHIKGLVVRVLCCPEYRNWQSLMCNEALNGGGGGLGVYSGAMIL